MVLLSLCLYEKPIFLNNVLEGLNFVTGGWNLFAGDEDSSLLPGLSNRITISSLFLERSGIIAGSLALISLIWVIMMLIKHINELNENK